MENVFTNWFLTSEKYFLEVIFEFQKIFFKITFSLPKFILKNKISKSFLHSQYSF